MAILAIGDIILSSLNDAYTVLLSPSSCVINADFDGSNPELASAYTNITVSKGGKTIPFQLTLDSLSNTNIKYKVSDAGGNAQRVAITSLPTDILGGNIELILKTTAGDYSTNIAFQFSVVRESTMLDWISDWESGKTEIGGTYLITPKIFVGSNLKSSNGTSSLTGVYIGPDSSLMGTSSAGLYGYKDGAEIFHLNETGGSIGGWTIASNSIQTADGNLKILSEGSIVSYDKSTVAWGLYKSGEASFAKGNVLFHKDGSAYFAGELRSQAGNIGGWNLQYGSLYSENVLLDAANDFIGIGQFNTSSTTESLGNRIQSVAQYGGVYMYYSSAKSYGMVGNLPMDTDGTVRQVFSLGATNKIASWNFDDEAFWIGSKTNALGGYTVNNQSITIGSCGLRGRSWYIDSNGEVSFANGRVIFDSDTDLYRIANWNIDNDALYIGTKALSGNTVTEGSITLSASGLRGRWWRLDSDGSGALARDSITWDQDGVLTVDGNVITGCISSHDGEMVLDLNNKTFTAQGTAVIYATNIQLQSSSTGEFEDVGSALRQLQSSMSGLRQDLTEGGSYLDNASFNGGLSSWETDNHGTLFTLGGKWLWINGAPYSNKTDFAAIKDDDGRRTVFIKNNYILQRNADFRHIPAYTEANSDGELLATSLYLTFYYKVKQAGSLSIEFTGSDHTGFEEFTEFGYLGDLTETGDYKMFSCAGLWNGTGDFKLSFTGEINIYMLTLSTDKTDTLIYRYNTFFNQSDKLINIAAANFDSDGNVLESSGILLKSDFAGLYVIGENGNIQSLVGASSDGIKIKGEDIILEGAITANGNIRITEDGQMKIQNNEIQDDYNTTTVSGTTYDTYEDLTNSSPTPVIIQDFTLPDDDFLYNVSLASTAAEVDISRKIQVARFSLPSQGEHSITIPKMTYGFKYHAHSKYSDWSGWNCWTFIHITVEDQNGEVAWTSSGGGGLPSSLGGATGINEDWLLEDTDTERGVVTKGGGEYIVYLNYSVQVSKHSTVPPSGNLDIQLWAYIAEHETERLIDLTYSNYSHIFSNGIAVISSNKKCFSVLNTPERMLLLGRWDAASNVPCLLGGGTILTSTGATSCLMGDAQDKWNISKVSTGVFLITHNMGFSNYQVQLTAGGKAASYFYSEKNDNSVKIHAGSSTEVNFMIYITT